MHISVLFAPFCGKSIQVPFPEPFTLTNRLSRSRSIKANQGKSRCFLCSLRQLRAKAFPSIRSRVTSQTAPSAKKHGGYFQLFSANST
jgi:hypothetical protein